MRCFLAVWITGCGLLFLGLLQPVEAQPHGPSASALISEGAGWGSPTGTWPFSAEYTPHALVVSQPATGAEYMIEGAVREDETRIPIPDAAVTLIDAETGNVLRQDLSTDVEGRFEATVSVSRTAVDDVPDRFSTHWVSTASPNPVPGAHQAALTIRYTAPPATTSMPTLEMFDVQGRVVNPQRSLSSGVYFYRLRFEDGHVSNTASFIRLGTGTLDPRLVRLRPDADRTAPAGKTWQDDLDVQVTVEKEGYVAVEETVTLAAGTTTPVSLRLASDTPTPEADESTFDVTYADDAFVVEGTAKEALVEADTVQHRYVFDASKLQQEGVTVEIGSVMLIEDLALRRVTSASRQGDALVVETREATLDELIEDGTMRWQQTVDYSSYRTAQFYAGKQACTPEKTETKVTFTCSSDPYTFTLEFKPGNGVTETKVEVQKSLGGESNLRMTGTGVVRDITTGGVVTYSEGEMEEMDLSQDAVRAEMTLEIAATGAGDGDQKFELPTPAFNLPFTVGPIPMHLSIGAELVFKLDVPLEATASATASVDLSYDADHGFTYEGDDVSVDASVNGLDIVDGNFDSASNFAFVDAQYGVAFPKVGFSILGNELAWIRVGFTTGTRLQFGPVCKSGYGRILVDGGYGLSFFGIDLTEPEEINLIDEQKVAPPGGCD